jgi:uncharacterized protein (DUF58 family)
MQVLLRLLTTDFCPQNNRWAPWRSPAGVIIAVAAAAVLIAFYGSSNGLVVAVSLSVVAAVGVAWPWITILTLRSELTFDRPRGRQGERSVVRILIENRAPWPAWAVGVDVGCHFQEPATAALGQPNRPADAVAPFLAPLQRKEIVVEIRPERRGELPRRTPKLRCGYPFSVWHAERRIEVVRPTLVWPTRLPTAEIADRGERAFHGEQLQQKIGTAGETLGVREYRRGDPLSRFHWKQTAKHGKLIVRELQSQAAPWIQIVLDLDPAVHTEESLETAVKLATGYAESAWQRGTGVELVTQQGSWSDSHRDVLDALARAELGPCASLGEWAKASAPLKSRRTARIVVTTDRVERPHRRGDGRWSSGQWIVVPTRDRTAKEAVVAAVA